MCYRGTTSRGLCELVCLSRTSERGERACYTCTADIVFFWNGASKEALAVSNNRQDRRWCSCAGLGSLESRNRFAHNQLSLTHSLSLSLTYSLARGLFLPLFGRRFLACVGIGF